MDETTITHENSCQFMKESEMRRIQRKKSCLPVISVDRPSNSISASLFFDDIPADPAQLLFFSTISQLLSTKRCLLSRVWSREKQMAADHGLNHTIGRTRIQQKTRPITVDTVQNYCSQPIASMLYSK